MKIYNSKSLKIERLIPLNDKVILMYTCGPTVYDSPHLGNWDCFLRWDILVRNLESQGYTVKRVMNITDVGHLVSDSDEGEDKILKGARREGTTAWKISEKYTNEFLEGMKSLNMIAPTHITKATDYIEEQINFIKDLESKGYTYKTSDGIYFNTSKFIDYPKFARLDIKNLKEGARVEVNKEKINPTDFALWKFSKQNEKRDMEWSSPWGKGFPGWHIECSTMALEKLGKTIDIHTGGIDHIPIHHTNEIAQSEARNEKTFANYWVHCNHMLIDGHKISKSLGNTYILDDLYSRGFTADEFRILILQSHYRKESHFSWNNLASAKNRLKRWKKLSALIYQSDSRYQSNGLCQELEILKNRISEAMNNDMNSPLALQIIDEAFNYVENNSKLDKNESICLLNFIEYIQQIFGINILVNDISTKQKERIMKRHISRTEEKWDESDTIRDELANEGIGIDDKPDQQRWYWIEQ